MAVIEGMKRVSKGNRGEEEGNPMYEKVENTVRTQSPIVAWYLRTFHGMRVFTKYCTPTLCVFGFVIYQQRWVLVHADHPTAMMPIF